MYFFPQVNVWCYFHTQRMGFFLKSAGWLVCICCPFSVFGGDTSLCTLMSVCWLLGFSAWRSRSLSKFTKRNLQTSISPIGVFVFSCIYFIQKSIIKIKCNGIMHNIIFCSHILLLDPSSLLYSERSKRWIDA